MKSHGSIRWALWKTAASGSSSIFDLAKHRRRNCSHELPTSRSRAEYIDWGLEGPNQGAPDGFTGFADLSVFLATSLLSVERPMCQRNIAYLNMYTYYTQVYYDSNFLCFFAFKNVYAPTCKHPPTEPETWENHPQVPNPPN